jgi:hypothetical protein
MKSFPFLGDMNFPVSNSEERCLFSIGGRFYLRVIHERDCKPAPFARFGRATRTAFHFAKIVQLLGAPVLTTLRFVTLAFLFALISACAPAASSGNAIPTQDPMVLATQIAANVFATLTAIAPTASSTPAASAPPAPSATPDASTALPISHGLGQRTKTSGCVSANALPDATRTPGAIFPDATAAKI